MAITHDIPTVNSSQRTLQRMPDPLASLDATPNAPSSLAILVGGCIAVLVGAWGGLAPYIGHAIHYSADGSPTWTWNLSHGLLSLLPGALAVGAGSVLIASALFTSSPVSKVSRAALLGASSLLGLSAIWFIIGSSVWPIYFTGGVIAPASSLRTFADTVGYFLGEGFVLAVLTGVVGTWARRSFTSRSERSAR